METIKEIVEVCHGNAVNKGFYDLPNSILKKMATATIEVSTDGENYNLEQHFSDKEIQAVKDAFIAQRLMLITSELGEALEANRKARNANLEAFKQNDTEPNGKYFKENFEAYIKDSLADEISDATIRIADLAGWLEIDLQQHVNLKHMYNTTREKMHGGKAY